MSHHFHRDILKNMCHTKGKSKNIPVHKHMPLGKFPHTSGISTIWRYAVTFISIELHCTRTIWKPHMVSESQIDAHKGSTLYKIKYLTNRGPHNRKKNTVKLII